MARPTAFQIGILTEVIFVSSNVKGHRPHTFQAAPKSVTVCKLSGSVWNNKQVCGSVRRLVELGESFTIGSNLSQPRSQNNRTEMLWHSAQSKSQILR